MNERVGELVSDESVSQSLIHSFLESVRQVVRQSGIQLKRQALTCCSLGRPMVVPTAIAQVHFDICKRKETAGQPGSQSVIQSVSLPVCLSV